MNITQLSYVSRPALGLTDEDLQGLLREARRKNTLDGITGFLLHRHHQFVQVLEGPPLTVTRTFQRIINDRRHTELVLVGCRPITVRHFQLWSMGFLSLPDEVSEVLKQPGDGMPRPSFYSYDHDALLALIDELASASTS